MSHWKISRRGFVGSSVAAAALGGAASPLSGQQRAGGYRLFWGDLHNHNAVGYAQGSLERSIDLAREQAANEINNKTAGNFNKCLISLFKQSQRGICAGTHRVGVDA